MLALGISGGNNLLIGGWSFVCVSKVDLDSRVYDVSMLSK
jgi:hypothetical protein